MTNPTYGTGSVEGDGGSSGFWKFFSIPPWLWFSLSGGFVVRLVVFPLIKIDLSWWLKKCDDKTRKILPPQMRRIGTTQNM